MNNAAVETENDDDSISLLMTCNVGTPLYIAPELFITFNRYNQKADVYSYGMCLYELATGTRPFREVRNTFQLQERVVSGQRPEIPAYVNPLWEELIQQCWSQYPSERPTMREVVDTIVSNRDEFMLDGCDTDEYSNYIDMVMKQ